ncbi:hypothetical protein NPIL_394931 [Nephila pilipes]|uniref:Uncharacterized protein n=1 Tax=Nephila pilipes TaxID=299642 RepID=A0A8X6NBT8_NEPPI|nr:hypothetical protein NPIL_394931 [Nephila pilipes]
MVHLVSDAPHTPTPQRQIIKPSDGWMTLSVSVIFSGPRPHCPMGVPPSATLTVNRSVRIHPLDLNGTHLPTPKVEFVAVSSFFRSPW